MNALADPSIRFKAAADPNWDKFNPDDFATLNTSSQALARLLFSRLQADDVTEYEQDVVANIIGRLRRDEFGDFSTPLLASTRNFLVALITSHIAVHEMAVDQSDPVAVDSLDDVLAPLRGLANHLSRMV